MVAAHIEEILAVQPTGPYRLGGWSLGGLFATATARALARLGHTVERVFLLDTWLPLDTTSDIAEQEDMVYRMILHPWLRDPDDVDRISLPWRRGDDHEKKERLLVDFVCTDKRFQPHLERGEVERLLNVQMALLRAESEFTSAPCEVPLLYIHATVMPQQEHDSQRVQSHDCVVVHIDCGHGECVKMPYVAQIAAAIDGSYEPPA
jgi:thioesterase domain-containing protein